MPKMTVPQAVASVAPRGKKPKEKIPCSLKEWVTVYFALYKKKHKSSLEKFKAMEWT